MPSWRRGRPLAPAASAAGRPMIRPRAAERCDVRAAISARLRRRWADRVLRVRGGARLEIIDVRTDAVGRHHALIRHAGGPTLHLALREGERGWTRPLRAGEIALIPYPALLQLLPR